MAPKETEQDPSIEEILASIRQIISDDDEPQPAEVASPAKAEKPAAREMAPPPSAKEDDILTLTDDMQESEDVTDFAAALNAIAGEQATGGQAPQNDSGIDLDNIFGDSPAQPFQDYEIGFNDDEKESSAAISARAEALDEFLTDVAAERASIALDDTVTEDTIFSGTAANATVDAFARLAENVVLTRKAPEDGALTLEEIVKDLMRPMLRQWINENVPRIVESLVEKELEKLARRARDE